MPFRPTKHLESTLKDITGQSSSQVPERLFMSTLLKHTIIALLIIIPLAALSAFAAEPVRVDSPFNQASNKMPFNQTSNKMPKMTVNTSLLKTSSGQPIRVGIPNINESTGSITPEAVASVDLSRYAGKWYEIARLPMYFQRKCTGDVTATYTPKTGEDDNAITVLNQCATKDGGKISASGIAVPANASGSKLKVSFLPTWLRWAPFGKADYWILAIDESYQTALVGAPNKKYLWLLSRQPQMDKDTYDRYRQIAEHQGYDLTDFQLTPQSQQAKP